jgi:hypothetical protein
MGDNSYGDPPTLEQARVLIRNGLQQSTYSQIVSEADPKVLKDAIDFSLDIWTYEDDNRDMLYKRTGSARGWGQQARVDKAISFLKHPVPKDLIRNELELSTYSQIVSEADPKVLKDAIELSLGIWTYRDTNKNRDNAKNIALKYIKEHQPVKFIRGAIKSASQKNKKDRILLPRDGAWTRF